jgi:hypothetical protein
VFSELVVRWWNHVNLMRHCDRGGGDEFYVLYGVLAPF